MHNWDVNVQDVDVSYCIRNDTTTIRQVFYLITVASINNP